MDSAVGKSEKTHSKCCQAWHLEQQIPSVSSLVRLPQQGIEDLKLCTSIYAMLGNTWNASVWKIILPAISTFVRAARKEAV
jgi:hypothetical protein